MLIPRQARQILIDSLNRQACVALLGPRQVGKTTLALQLSKERASRYLDLERQSDRLVLQDVDFFFGQNRDKLIILDEIHRTPDIFSQLRGEIDRARFEGIRNNMYLILGSASMDLLRQSSESLAGRLTYVHLDPINIVEAQQCGIDLRTLWLRGGFPDSLISSSDADSFNWRSDFIKSYLERDLKVYSNRSPTVIFEQLWTMLAHVQGAVVNFSSLSKSLGISAPTVRSFIELLEKLLLVRILRPFHANVAKQYVKSPKIYIRDSGLSHALLGLQTDLQLWGHPVVGSSWEGLVIENILSVVPTGTLAHFYRTAKGAEIDLVLQFPGFQSRWAIEIKRNVAARTKKGFHIAKEDIGADKCFVVHTGTGRVLLSPDIEALGLLEICTEIQDLAN